MDNKINTSDIHLAKYSKPSRFDCAPEGTIIKAFLDEHVGNTSVGNTRVDGKNYKYYIQISEYKDLPNWVTWDYFLGLILEEKALDADFVSKCITAFKLRRKKNNPNAVKEVINCIS